MRLLIAGASLAFLSSSDLLAQRRGRIIRSTVNSNRKRDITSGSIPTTTEYGVPELYAYELDEIREAESLLPDRVTSRASRPRGHSATPSSPAR